MKELSRDELRETQISILDYFASICQKYNLTYWLHFGTLLGAVRHKGYIPWDDDIDVAMLREDYEKLIKVLKMEDIDSLVLRTIQSVCIPWVN